MRPLLQTNAQWPVVERLLDEALDQPAAEWERWLQALAPEHAALKGTLQQLLQAHAQAESADIYGTLPRLAAPSKLPADGPAAGDEVGPYRLLRELGQGGMGSVWLAERGDGQLKRPVALKLPRLSWVPGLAARMARERDILATLQHPHIARLYDAGLDDHGRPYLAIEFVEGQGIDAYAQQRTLELPARLALLLQVASAVAYAHSRLVVHRDLKPSNILVTKEGQVRLLDFGIAKLLATDSNDDSALTQTAGRALTPEYASPEQLRSETIGTASDVYSLGVVAFELLAGLRPYWLKAGRGAAALADAAARIDVPLASQRASDPALQRQLKGDLDAILSRALAADPQERYATVQAMADDLGRHLAGEPVLARAPSRVYVAERWVRRHKAETAVALALALAVVGGAYAQVLVLLSMGAGTLVALWQRRQALQHAAVAQAATARAEQVKDFIGSIFTQAVPRAGSGGSVAAADLLRAAAQRVETDLSGQPAVAAELAALIGASFNELSETRAGLEWLPKAVAMCNHALGPAHPLTLQSRWRLAEAANNQGELAVSQSVLPSLLRDLRAAQPPQHELLLQAMSSHAWVHTKLGNEAEAVSALAEAVETAHQHFGASSRVALLACCSLSNTCIHFRRTSQALQAISGAFELAQEVLGGQRPHLVLSAVERDMANAMTANRRPRDARVLLQRVLSDQRLLDGEESGRVRTAMMMLGMAWMHSGHFDDALLHFEQAAQLHTRLTGGLNQEGLSGLSWLARACVLKGDGSGALAHLARLDDIARTLPAEAEFLQRGYHVLRMEALALAGHCEEVLAATEALAVGPLNPTGPLDLRLLVARCAALQHRGRLADALVCAQQAAKLADAGDCQALAHGLALREVARCHGLLGQHLQAQQRWRELLQLWDVGQVDGQGLLADAHQEYAALSVSD